MYLPGHLDAQGTGRAVEQEVTERLNAAVAGDPWFAEHPLRIAWTEDVVPAEVPADHEIVTTLRAAAADVGRQAGIGGPELLARRGHVHALRDADRLVRSDGIESAHGVDEWTSIDGLVDACASYAADRDALVRRAGIGA